MIKKINAVIVVEGKSDQSFLESFIDAEFVLTNGSDVPRETINYLKELSKSKKIIVLTDPDSPGKRIRSIIQEHIPNVIHAFVDKKYCIKKHKVGIAECDKEHVLEALENLCDEGTTSIGNLTMNDLFSLNLVGAIDSSLRRDYVSSHFHIGHNNAKSLLKRLNSLNISFEELEEFLRSVKNECSCG